MSASSKPVVVVPYDPLWPEQFEEAERELEGAIGANLLAIHHIGSTSIPGIYAKPTIDMLGVVADLAALDAAADGLVALGYEARGEFGIPGRRYFPRNNAADERTHQLHAFRAGSQHIGRHLAFRDFLRAHPDVAQEYSELKRRLATAHMHDREAYMDGKDPFIEETEARSLVWAALPHR